MGNGFFIIGDLARGYFHHPNRDEGHQVNVRISICLLDDQHGVGSCKVEAAPLNNGLNQPLTT